ncbi:bifunctional diaminohydroxyphosphoribosylaminopyrimidine deaminase/5-amino-6-(5-phosphoribosylamino)uracil reductase RibD [Helicobacter suis]|uniref:bifunctional diaminohydroxyphosphoribosylaminopyrimidine deaminase/5-amino-6-(5-phosphoribosylamino)uracil reductase RibD n=1 Tax=Helicobacter suis TaxID=104628 RepID=UPI0013D57D13|nr:bifunctional diaminohydroxyphosphoribosylaminopyrimidine deaminase/5-amino-6-(5-phosphoribosylamino)uracil reductase RibD [Helicobacter suis]
MLTEILMRACIEHAYKSQTLALPNPSVACMILDQHCNILALQDHSQANTPHAEVLALKEAYNKLSPTPFPKEINPKDREQTYQFLSKHHNNLFKNCTLLVTLEPCNHFGKTPPCAALLAQIKPKKVIISCLETHKKAMGGLACLKEAGIEVISGILEKEGKVLLYPFTCLEQKGVFNLFKIATRLNGSFEGKISGQFSQIFTHTQRSIANYLIISGKSVRHDRPILDSRLSAYTKRPPNVAIFTRDTTPFDSSIPLFQVPNRHVQVCHTSEELPLQQGFNIIEGGWDLFVSLQKHIDMLLIHQNSTLAGSPQSTQIPLTSLIFCDSQLLGSDLLEWFICDSTNL